MCKKCNNKGTDLVDLDPGGRVAGTYCDCKCGQALYEQEKDEHALAMEETANKAGTDGFGRDY